MNLTPLFKNEFWNVEISWSRPTTYENVIYYGTDRDDEAYLYIIAAKYGSNKSKILYIGKTYKQTVSVRLNQEDHKKRYRKFRKEYPRHKLYISYGIVKMKNGKLNSNRIKEIEKILIYSNKTEHSYNVSNLSYHGVTDSYKIKNSGYKHTLPEYLYLGVFSR